MLKLQAYFPDHKRKTRVREACHVSVIKTKNGHGERLPAGRQGHGRDKKGGEEDGKENFDC